MIRIEVKLSTVQKHLLPREHVMVCIVSCPAPSPPGCVQPDWEHPDRTEDCIDLGALFFLGYCVPALIVLAVWMIMEATRHCWRAWRGENTASRGPARDMSYDVLRGKCYTMRSAYEQV